MTVRIWIGTRLLNDAVLAELDRRATDDVVAISMTELAATVGCCRSAVCRAIADLRKEGRIIRLERGGGLIPRSTYRLTHHM